MEKARKEGQRKDGQREDGQRRNHALGSYGSSAYPSVQRLGDTFNFAPTIASGNSTASTYGIFHATNFYQARAPPQSAPQAQTPSSYQPQRQEYSRSSPTLGAVAAAGAALRVAIDEGYRAASLVDLIVALEDAMLAEMRQHDMSYQWAKDSNVKLHCRYLRKDPVDHQAWGFMKKALETNMERVEIVNPTVSPEDIFDGFKAQSLYSAQLKP